MAINKIPKNYYSDTNIRRDKINEIIDEVNNIASIPSPSAADAGKIIKVGEDGAYELGAGDSGDNKAIYTLTRIPDSTYYNYPNGITGKDIYDEFISGKDIELRIVHRSLGTVIIRPSVYNDNAIFFTGTLYDGTNTEYLIVRCTVDNLSTETSSRPFFTSLVKEA